MRFLKDWMFRIGEKAVSVTHSAWLKNGYRCAHIEKQLKDSETDKQKKKKSENRNARRDVTSPVRGAIFIATAKP